MSLALRLVGVWQAIIVVFLLVGAMELVFPWRSGSSFASARSFSNLGLWLIAVALDYLLQPLLAFVPQPSFGAFGWWGQLVIGIPALDAASYGLHRLFHSNQFLWGFHALHHSDPEVDVTTTVRHHPGETLLMAVVIASTGAALGLSPAVVGLYAVANLCIQFFVHANIALPPGLSRIIGLVLVAPGMHRIHHSRASADFGSNFGVVLSIWDRLFRTYQDWAQRDMNGLEFGIDTFRDTEFQRPGRMLLLPVLLLKHRERSAT